MIKFLSKLDKVSIIILNSGIIAGVIFVPLIIFDFNPSDNSIGWYFSISLGVFGMILFMVSIFYFPLVIILLLFQLMKYKIKKGYDIEIFRISKNSIKSILIRLSIWLILFIVLINWGDFDQW